MINEQIRDREVRLIGENGEQLGIMSAREAMKLAEEAELDLVKIAPTAKPPVCKIIDYGKYRYELARKEKEAKKKQKVVELKEIRLSPNIDLNDLNTKMNAAKKFLSKGDKVKITLRFRGREMAHMNASKHILDDFAESLSDTLGTDKFLKDFDLYFAKLYDGIRHDSGDPIKWGYKVLNHYEKLRINPMTKTLLFSDSLDFERAYKIYKEFKDKTNVTFGIGTFIMNDFKPISKPLNIVMKLQSVNGKPVAKLSDDNGKTICEDKEFLHYLKIVSQE